MGIAATPTPGLRFRVPDVGEDHPPIQGLTRTFGPEGIPAGLSFGKPSIQMSTSMWLVWWNLALDHLATAEAARAEIVKAVTAGERQAWSEPLMREMEGSLQAVCAAAFAARPWLSS